MELKKLKISIKKWEHQFQRDNGRVPGKDDLKKHPDVKKMYKQYASLKKYKSKESVEKAKSPKKLNRTPITKESVSIFGLGPTPQIYGKSVSIFEMAISPLNSEVPNITIEEPNINGEQKSIKRQLNFSITPGSSPGKLITDKAPIVNASNTENIFFAKKNSLLPPPISKPPLHSPLRLEENNIHMTIRRTPMKLTNLSEKLRATRTASSDSFSPSPLIKRPLSKSVFELEQENQKIFEEFKEIKRQADETSEEEITDESDDDDENLGDASGKNKDEGNDDMITNKEMVDIFNDPNFTKKSKRKRVMRRLETTAAEFQTVKPSVIPKDLHKELYKIKKRQVNNMLDKDEDSGLSDNDDEENAQELNTEQAVVKKKRAKKYNLVSNNFRRYKLKKSMRGNRRWTGRKRY